MCSLSVILACSLLLITTSCGQLMDGAIGFPEKEENMNVKNKENREPVFLPSMCPENQLFYPGDQKDDWICDCRPSHLYHPATDKCWPAYRKGPCQDGQFLVLPPNTYIPACAPNPCVGDSFVPWGAKCERLGSTKPCAYSPPHTVVLGVNATNLQIACVVLNIEVEPRILVPPVFAEPLKVAPCPPGCKRSIKGVCVPS